MGAKSKLTVPERRKVVLSLIRREEPAAVSARRFGIAEGTLYRWRDEFLAAGEAALANGKNKADAHDRQIAELKKDLIDPNNTRRYYYNNNWQVLCEYNSSGNPKMLYIYGNYIDEVLFAYELVSAYYYWYAHDHLYSPAALIDSAGDVSERYEYDAYGRPTIWDANLTTERNSSNYENPYYFQGKMLDLLDANGLKLMSWPYRNYSTYLGRWLQAEKLGMIPNDDEDVNPFVVFRQYTDGLNLYEYVRSNPINGGDPTGLYLPPRPPGSGPPGWMGRCGVCGPNLSGATLKKMEREIAKDFRTKVAADPGFKDKMCGFRGMYGPRGWDIVHLHGAKDFLATRSCGTCDCSDTVTIGGKCYDADEVNYYLWGFANKLCGHTRDKAVKWARRWARWRPDRADCKVKWTEAGYDGRSHVSGCTVAGCKTSCTDRVDWLRPYIKHLYEKPYRW